MRSAGRESSRPLLHEFGPFSNSMYKKMTGEGDLRGSLVPFPHSGDAETMSAPMSRRPCGGAMRRPRRSVRGNKRTHLERRSTEPMSHPPAAKIAQLRLTGWRLGRLV